MWNEQNEFDRGTINRELSAARACWFTGGEKQCLWRQINQNIHFPVRLKVDNGTIACFSVSGKILEWFTPGEYYLGGLKKQDLGIVLQETAVGWDKLRLYYFTQISDCEIKMRSDIAAASMVIQCRIIDVMLFWSHFLKASYCQLLKLST